MTAINLYLDTRAPRKDGSCPIKVAVNNNGRFFISLGIYTRPDYFINGEVIIPNDPAKMKSVNKFLRDRLLQIENTINKLTLLGELRTMPNKRLKVLLENNTLEGPTTPASFLDYYEKIIAEKGKARTKDTYKYTLNKIAEFCNINTLTFTDINLRWLKDFDAFMAKTCKINTRSIHMRNLRAVFNSAIDEDIIEQNLYPFRKFKIKKEATRKRSLMVEEIRTIRDYPCEPHMERYRDIFMLTFYLIGINTIDLLNLKEIRNGRIEYRRAKTGRLYSIKVEPEALEIIEKYKGKNYLLNMMDGYSDYRTFLSKMNKHLRKMGEVKLVERAQNGIGKKEYTPLFPDISIYWARYSWATTAAQLDIPKETISAALGHNIGSEVTSIYIKFDERKIDIANRAVIDYLSAPSSFSTCAIASSTE